MSIHMRSYKVLIISAATITSLIFFQNCSPGLKLNNRDSSELTTAEELIDLNNKSVANNQISKNSRFNYNLGVAQSDLVWHPNDKNYPPEKLIRDIGKTGSKWLRTNFRSSAEAAYFASLALQGNQNRMSLVATILQEPEDYIIPEYGPSNPACGWNGGALKFSKLDLEKYKSRLNSYLKALDKKGVSIAAFEIGNELDWNCFNGDIAIDNQNELNSSNSTLLPFIDKYAKVLEASSKMIRSYPRFSKSKILTFGAANCSLFTQRSCLLDPHNILQKLRSYNGVDYIKKYADAAAIHLYPNPNGVEPFSEELEVIKKYALALGDNKPVWITETGFEFTDGINNHSDLYNRFLMALNTANSVSHVFIYTYFSYALEKFSLSSGPQGPVDKAIDIFSLTPVLTHAICDNKKQWGCALGVVTSSNGLTACETKLTWTCAGTDQLSVKCERMNDRCPR